MRGNTQSLPKGLVPHGESRRNNSSHLYRELKVFKGRTRYRFTEVMTDSRFRIVYSRKATKVDIFCYLGLN